MAVQRAAELTIVLQAKNLAKQEFNRLNKQLGGLTRNIQKYQNEIRAVSKAALAVGVIGATLFTGAVVQAAGFEKALSNVTAVTNASIEDQKKLRDAALDMGSKSVFSASQAAEAQLFLGQAGQSTTQIIQSLSGVMELAAATSADLGFASEVTAATLSQFRLQASEASRVANVFAASSSASQATLDKLAFAMRQAGPIANSLGLSLEETTAALNLLFNAGFKGEQAGTILRGTLSKLIKPSKEAADILNKLGIRVNDTSGKMLPFIEIIKQLEIANLDTAQAITIFGEEAGPGLIALLGQGSKALEEMTTKITGTQEAARQAAERTNNLSGSVTQLKSALEGASISIGTEFIPTIRSVTETVTGWVRAFNDMDPATKSLVADIGIIVTVLAGFVGGLGLLVTTLAVTKISLGALGLGLGALLKILGKVGLALTALSAGWEIGKWLNNFKIVRLAASDFIQFFHQSFIGLKLVWSEFFLAVTSGIQKLVNLFPQNSFFDELSVSMTGWIAVHEAAIAAGGLELEKVRENWESVRQEIEKQGDTFNKTAEKARVLGAAMQDAHIKAFQAIQNQNVEQETLIQNIEKQTEAIYALAEADLKVLEAEQAVVAEQLKSANIRATALKQILDVEANLKSFITQLGEKGLSSEEKDKNELIRQEQALAQVIRQSTNEKIALLREVRFLEGEEKEAVLKKLQEQSLTKQVEELKKVVDVTQSLALAAEKGSIQEASARDLAINASEKLKRTLIDLGIAQGQIDAQALKSGKSIEDQYRTTLHQVDQLEAKFETLKEKIKDIQARITIVDQQALINDAARLRSNLESQFSQPIVQEVIMRQVNSLAISSTSSGLSVSNVPQFATGLNRVPYDNFPALLHRGEQVLTASEAKQADQQQGPITSTFGDIILENGDPEEFVREVAPLLRDALANYNDRIN